MDYSHEGDFGSAAHAAEVAGNTKLFLDMGVQLSNIVGKKTQSKEMVAEFNELGAPSPGHLRERERERERETHMHTYVYVHMNACYSCI